MKCFRRSSGAPQTLSPPDVIARWRPLLSAFDATQHVVHQVAVELTRTDAGWKAARMRMISEESTGNASLFDEARAHIAREGVSR